VRITESGAEGGARDRANDASATAGSALGINDRANSATSTDVPMTAIANCAEGERRGGVEFRSALDDAETALATRA
jgi:hypothetical protein